jgi:iron complex outermembrane receptor protein
VSGSFTVGLEHSVLRQRTAVSGTYQLAPGGQGGGPLPPASSSTAEIWRHDTGILAQASAALDNSFFLSGGLRVESNDAFAAGARRSVLPMVGASWVGELGGAELKLRAAYGKGIRPPQSPALTHGRLAMGTPAVSNGLDPEVQRGIEGGVELHFGSAFSLQVTRFDQHATGLLQNVVTSVDTVPRVGAPKRRVQYELQNVGAIRNRGWELGATATHGQLSMTSAFAQVSSRVEAIAAKYLGDLRVGDRMLEVPARTASVSAQWTSPRWTASVGLTRAFDWVDYDRLSLGQSFLAAPIIARQLYGARLRQYWRHYDGENHLRANWSVELRRGLSLVSTGENLLGGQLGEPDNLTVRPGRTITAGLRAGF